MNILEGTNVGVQIGNRTLYSGVNFALKEGTTLAVTGENGVGKTTLVRAVVGKRPVSAGTIKWPQGKQVISYVPQYRAEADEFGLRMRDFVALSFDQGVVPWLRRKERTLLASVLQQTGLTTIASRRIDTASGGERQRAYLAQALIRQPQLLILDEATANLDVQAKFALMDVIHAVQKQTKLSVLMVSHDPEIVQVYANTILHIEDGTGELKQNVGVRAHV